MYYLTTYEEYPIYHPEEGGYYQAGQDVTSYQMFKSFDDAREALLNDWNECKKDNMFEYGEEEPICEHHVYPWMLIKEDNGNLFIRKASLLIGEGTLICIEENLGEQTIGFIPYE